MMDCPGSKSLAIHPPLQCGVRPGAFRRRRGEAQRERERQKLLIITASLHSASLRCDCVARNANGGRGGDFLLKEQTHKFSLC